MDGAPPGSKIFEMIKGKKEKYWLSVGVVAQWQNTGGLNQWPWVRELPML